MSHTVNCRGVKMFPQGCRSGMKPSGYYAYPVRVELHTGEYCDRFCCHNGSEHGWGESLSTLGMNFR